MIYSIDYGMRRYANLFRENGFEVVSNSDEHDLLVDDISLIVFSGGEDVDPAEYGEPNFHSWSNPKRDKIDKGYYKFAKDNNIPCVGICRGAQFLTVMNGGKLVQDVRGHTSSHQMHTHDGRIISVSSTHHQMMRPEGTHHEMLGWGVHGWDKFDGYGKEVIQSNPDLDRYDPEVVWYPKTRDLAVQYHPEIMDQHSPGYQFFFELMEKYYG